MVGLDTVWLPSLSLRQCRLLSLDGKERYAPGVPEEIAAVFLDLEVADPDQFREENGTLELRESMGRVTGPFNGVLSDNSLGVV